MTYEYAALELAGATADGPQYRIVYRERWSGEMWKIDGDYGPIYNDFAAKNLADMLNDRA